MADPEPGLCTWRLFQAVLNHIVFHNPSNIINHFLNLKRFRLYLLILKRLQMIPNLSIVFGIVLALQTVQSRPSKNADEILAISCWRGAKIVTYVSDDPLYNSTLLDRAQNLAFVNKNSRKPFAILLPTTPAHIQNAIICMTGKGPQPRKSERSIQLLVRGGGHSYEAFSWTAGIPFAILDMSMISKVVVYTRNNTAVVGGGATLGHLYTEISSVFPAGQPKKKYGFPGGSCPSVGVGGRKQCFIVGLFQRN